MYADSEPNLPEAAVFQMASIFIALNLGAEGMGYWELADHIYYLNHEKVDEKKSRGCFGLYDRDDQPHRWTVPVLWFLDLLPQSAKVVKSNWKMLSDDDPVVLATTNPDLTEFVLFVANSGTQPKSFCLQLSVLVPWNSAGLQPKVASASCCICHLTPIWHPSDIHLTPQVFSSKWLLQAGTRVTSPLMTWIWAQPAILAMC